MPALLAPVIFVRSREPFERLVVILEMVPGRGGVGGRRFGRYGGGLPAG